MLLLFSSLPLPLPLPPERSKYCIDQNAIDLSVRRLPIFVVASSKFFVLLGPSYATRCWCMLELFVFNSVQRSGLFRSSDLIIAPLKSKTTGNADVSMLANLAASFNVHNTMCFCDVDRQTIFGIVETAGDGHKGFDNAVRALAAGAAAGEMPPADVDVSASEASGGTARRRRGVASPPRSPPMSDEAAGSSSSDEEVAPDLEAGLPAAMQEVAGEEAKPEASA